MPQICGRTFHSNFCQHSPNASRSIKETTRTPSLQGLVDWCCWRFTWSCCWHAWHAVTWQITYVNPVMLVLKMFEDVWRCLEDVWRCLKSKDVWSRKMFEVLGVATPRIGIHRIQCWWPWDSPLSHSWPWVLRWPTWLGHVTWHHPLGLRYWRGPGSVNLETPSDQKDLSTCTQFGRHSKKQKFEKFRKHCSSNQSQHLHFSGHSGCPGGLLIDEFSGKHQVWIKLQKETHSKKDSKIHSAWEMRSPSKVLCGFWKKKLPHVSSQNKKQHEKIHHFYQGPCIDHVLLLENLGFSQRPTRHAAWHRGLDGRSPKNTQ